MITESIINQLKTVSDPERKKASRTMFPTSMEFLGVRTPEMRKLLKEWWVEIK
jgi:hypothetical protein